MISAVAKRGLMRFMFYSGTLNADQFIAFLRRLGRDVGQKTAGHSLCSLDVRYFYGNW